MTRHLADLRDLCLFLVFLAACLFLMGFAA